MTTTPNLVAHPRKTSGALVAAFLSIFVLAFFGGCETAADNFDSRVACKRYCSKKYDCDDKDPPLAELNECINDRRDTIEDKCGNEHQAEANDKILECVDQSCEEFPVCMVFEAAPECFGFVN